MFVECGHVFLDNQLPGMIKCGHVFHAVIPAWCAPAQTQTTLKLCC